MKQDFRHTELTRQKFYGVDFSEQNLSRLKLRGSLFKDCNFDNADMTETECEGSEFVGSSFRNTICYRTNFKDAKLAATTFAPKDCFGMTISMNCFTFQNAKVSQIWWYAWLYMGTQMNSSVPEDRDRLIAAIGHERFGRLRGMFSKREV